MDNGARIRINRETGEIEISGSEQFVKDHMNLVQDVLGAAPKKASAPVSTPKTAAPAPAPAAAPKAEVAAPAAPAKEPAAEAPAPAAPKRGRGRPRKNPVAATAAASTASAEAPKASTRTTTAAKTPNTFSGYMKTFKRKMKKGDWVLAAGHYFITSTNSDSFSTFNTSKLLKSQGVELANPSQYMKNNISSGRIEAVGKRNYRVTEEGRKHLNFLASKK